MRTLFGILVDTANEEEWVALLSERKGAIHEYILPAWIFRGTGVDSAFQKFKLIETESNGLKNYQIENMKE